MNSTPISDTTGIQTRRVYDKLSDIKILIVDNDEPVLNLLKRLLSGYDVTILASSYEAAKLTLHTSFDIYIIDYQLPGLNGVELFEQIADENKEVYIGILSTIRGMISHLKEHKENGIITYFLEKPVNTDTLKDLVNKAAEIIQKSREINYG